MVFELLHEEFLDSRRVTELSSMPSHVSGHKVCVASGIICKSIIELLSTQVISFSGKVIAWNHYTYRAQRGNRENSYNHAEIKHKFWQM